MKWRAVHASVRGTAHQRMGMPNQDAVAYGESAEGMVLAVADGHGSGRHFRSQVGSVMAVQVGVTVVLEYVSGGKGDLAELGRQVAEAWLAAVRADLEQSPFLAEELQTLEESVGGRSRVLVEERPELAYGATLLIAATTESRLIFMQLGDGDILVVGADGTTTRPIADDARLVGNQTTSLCQPEAWREFRTAEVTARQGLPVLVLLSTDGYVNSFGSQEEFAPIGRRYLQILRERGPQGLAEELPGILTEATQQKSGDDITLGILHSEAIRGDSDGVKEGGAKPVTRRRQSVRRRWRSILGLR
jgi:Protein phosphatase 2C